jgi:hypothetical protein
MLSIQTYDIVNLRLEVPTVKGLLEKTPAYMDFEITSTEQRDIGGFLNEIRELVRHSGLIWIRETYV